MNQELLTWAKAQLGKAEESMHQKNHDADVWGSGSDKKWRDLANSTEGVYYTKSQRMKKRDTLVEQSLKIWEDVQNWKQVVALLEGKGEDFLCRYCGAKSNKDCICGPFPV